MRANVDSDETFLGLDPLRKIRTEPCTPDRHALSIGFGTDWSGLPGRREVRRRHRTRRQRLPPVSGLRVE
jgi:hypothetical protein